MKTLIFRTDHTAVSPDDIKSFELIVGIRLPGEYVSFLLQHNGGSLDERNKYYYAVPERFSDGCISVDSFFPLGELADRFISRRLDYSENLLPIGIDDFGNYICVGVKGEKYGAIFFVDHEVSDEKTGQNLTIEICENLKAFVEMLVADE